MKLTNLALIATLAASFSACKGDDSDSDTDAPPPPTPWVCQIPDGPTPASVPQIGCQADFDLLAAEPLDASIPGARSLKTALDRADDNTFHFIDTQTYPIHWEFAFEHLSGDGLPIVPQLGQFNTSEYYSPDRRFVLGAVTYYEGPAEWVYEISPYDTASAEMIEQAYEAIAENAWFGDDLKFHPTSGAIETVAESLPDSVQVITTEELFAGITYQPLNLATSMGLLSFYEDGALDEVPPWFREIVVLQSVPNDLSVVQGLITEQFQTPLSHVNVLSQNRGTPNMGLRGAFDSPELRALEGKWVELITGPFEYSIREVTQEEAEAWWQANRPDPIDVEPMNTTVTGLVDLDDVIDREANPVLLNAIRAAVPAFGGKVTHYAAMRGFEFTGEPIPPGFAIPIHYFDNHMTQNNLWALVEENLADEQFNGDPEYRATKLAELRMAIATAPLDPELEQAVIDKLTTGVADGVYPTARFRFRSSTNAEDVSGFNGAGLYTSETGDPNDPTRPVRDAIRITWSSVYSVRAFEERTYYGIDHRNIGMALLCHRSFPEEDANGVAITANIFDTTGVEPAYYINVQEGDEPVVRPDPDITTDQILYYYTQPGQPIVYLGNSNLIPPGFTVLSNTEMNQLGQALQVIHQGFASSYGSGGGFYGMDVEFKFDQQFDAEPTLYIKQARPYPGWGAIP